MHQSIKNLELLKPTVLVYSEHEHNKANKIQYLFDELWTKQGPAIEMFIKNIIKDRDRQIADLLRSDEIKKEDLINLLEHGNLEM